MPVVVIAPPALIVATPGLLLVQLLAGVVASCRVLATPWHMNRFPVMAAGCGLLVIVMPLAQPVPSVYTTVVLPAPTPVITPVPEPTDIMVPSRLLQLPPPAHVSVVVEPPAHMDDEPVIAPGAGFTVTDLVAAHPLLRV